MTSGVLDRLSFDRHGILGEDRGRVKQRPMVLAAIEAVANADPIRLASGRQSNRAAQAPAAQSIHSAPPFAILVLRQFATIFTPGADSCATGEVQISVNAKGAFE